MIITIKGTNFIQIDILDKVLDSKYWREGFHSSHLTGHIYYNSPIESDDNCGTCDGANCDICERITDEDNIEFGINTDTLCSILKEENIPEDVAEELAYGESNKYEYDGVFYRLRWPYESDLKEKFPEKYAEILEEVEKRGDKY